MRPLEVIPLTAIRDAAQQLADVALRTPLVPLHGLDLPFELFLKLENLQPIGSFKLRGAAHAMARIDGKRLARGVYTASAGNMAQGVAWSARRLGVPCRVIVPDRAPATKLEAIERFGGEIIKVPYERWWQVLVSHHHPGLDGLFIHPVSNADVIAGNGTIGLEIFEDVPDVDVVVAPYGGGGLSSGIASALRVLRPEARVCAAEVDTAAPLAASLAAGRPTAVSHQPSFVDGIGGKSLLPEMWPLVSAVLAGSVVVSVDEITAAIRLLATRARVIAEGAGAAPLAAAIKVGKQPEWAKHHGTEADSAAAHAWGDARKVVCVVSGGNIDAQVLARILTGQTP